MFSSSEETAIFSKVAIAASSFVNEFYHGRYGPEFSVSMRKETITLVQNCVSETSK